MCSFFYVKKRLSISFIKTFSVHIQYLVVHVRNLLIFTIIDRVQYSHSVIETLDTNTPIDL